MLRNNAVLRIALALLRTKIVVEKGRDSPYNEHAFGTVVRATNLFPLYIGEIQGVKRNSFFKTQR